MSIRVKLLLSYTGMLVISLLMFFLAASLFTIAATGDIHSFRDFYKVHYQLNPLTEQEESIFLELKYFAKNEPDKLLDKSLLQDYDFKLKTVRAGLYVRRESNQVFESLTFNQPELEKSLPPYDLNNSQIRNTFNIGERFYAYAKFDFLYSDGAKGSVFVIRERSPFSEVTRRLLPILVCLLLGVLIVANVLLYRWITRSVVKPLDRLRHSAENIKEGNLDFALPESSKDEIGQLNEAFENMRRRLQESVQLRLQDEESRKELISNISHDLRTPITNIKGYIEGIRDGVADTPEKMDKYVNIIYAKAVDLDKLVDELFLYSKLDLKQVPFTFEPVDITSFLDDCIDELHYDLEEKGIRLQWEQRPQESVAVIADLEKIKRTVLNIIENAQKFMDKPDKHILVSVMADPNWATVEIKDNGIGIPEEAIPHLFERFYRAEQSRNSSTGGSGLGLSIARQIIEGHGGEIWVKSKQGSGTSLFFSLPRMNQQGGADTYDDAHPHH
ncbi:MULTISPECIES: cell wall metabolism sensor histidine kinase WalK [Brevibacillus]|jgi:signal transduction histidine kinase|uniref:sensor histidine kinase n=1 Tax=Brevibacillus TaxID=55080 RepID=UPI00156B27D7|nr:MULTISPECIES: HAMP domain-containing sensor histidine kinase [Brevibacillus]MDH6352822.1 signal transduction histidine kinase [Brevibacillus sp. 1238]NRQ54967.1 HAMP domain-containing histidine kinase [Brevibacillus sp. HD1.4A]UED69878.1 HAMP domain-containing histidine kinase [Brevibacillus sp. HD3.3A]